MDDVREDKEERHREHIQSLERALDILERLAAEQHGLGVTELSTEVGLHKSTTHRLLSTLAERSYVEKNAEGDYQLGIKLIEVVSVYINSLELMTEARPYVARTSAELGLTSHLGVLEGDQVVYVERMDVLSGIKLYSQTGIRVHAYCSSLGKCLLSNFSKDELDAILAECSFNKFTSYTISSLEEMHVEIKKVRAQGWAMDDCEFDLNNRCVGAPIYDYRGEIIAAISASGPPTLLTRERVQGVADYLMKTAAEISRKLGYRV